MSDLTIQAAIESGSIIIDPYEPNMIQPASIDVRLGEDFIEFDNENMPVTKWGERWLEPGGFMLGSTHEWIKLPHWLAARFEGKSSLGRMGLMTHVTAGFVDPGFKGNLTVELHNVSKSFIQLRPGDPIGQLCFMTLDRPVGRPYGTPGLNSHYQNQTGATPAR